MKRLPLFLLAIALSVAAFGQTVTKAELAKDNGKGKPGTVVKAFEPADSPLHYVIHLKPLSSTVVFTGTLIAIEASNVKNYKVVSTNLSATPPMDVVDFKFTLPRPWPKGSYKIEVKANGKVLRDVSFEIK